MNDNIVTFQFYEDTNQLKAITKFPADGSVNFQINDDWIQQNLKENNFEKFYVPLWDGNNTLAFRRTL